MKVLALRIGEVLALPSMKFENSSDSATKSSCSIPLSQGTAVFSQNVPRDFKIMNDNALVTTFYLKHAVLVSCKKSWGLVCLKLKSSVVEFQEIKSRSRSNLLRHLSNRKNNFEFTYLLIIYIYFFFFWNLVLVSWQAFISSLVMKLDFYKPTVHKLHPPFCRITAHATVPGYFSSIFSFHAFDPN